MRITGVEQEEIPANTRLFLTTESHAPDVSYVFHLVDQLPAVEADWHLVYEKPNIQVFEREGLEQRVIGVGSPDDAYAVYREERPGQVDVFYLASQRADLAIDTVFISCLSLERQMERLGGFILHCAYMVYQGRAVLFSGPSGIGKSTQAGIWAKNVPGAYVVNGDRCLLTRNEQGEYEANGWPVCGSSGICHVETHPVEAIIFVQQRPDNAFIPENVAMHFKRLTTQITVNYWNQAATEHGLNFIGDLLAKVRVETYGCNMDPEAAFTLRKHLFENAQ